MRADAIEIGAGTPGNAENAVPARVRVVEYLGTLVRVELDVRGFERFGVTMTERAFLSRTIRPDTEVVASWPVDDTHLMPASRDPSTSTNQDG